MSLVAPTARMRCLVFHFALRFCWVITLYGAFAPTLATAAPRYAVVALRGPAGEPIRPIDLNDRGEVLGAIGDANSEGGGAQEFVIWKEGRVTTRILLPEHHNAYVSALNNRGQVAGGYLTTDGKWHVFRWDRRGLTLLEDLPGGVSDAVDINNRGHIAGTVWLEDGGSAAVVWEDQHPIALPPAGARSRSVALAINDAGQVVGGGGMDGVLWTHGRAIVLPFAGGFINRGVDINNRGQVVIFGDDSDFYDENMLWYRGHLSALEGHGRASSINSRGDVVGTGPCQDPDDEPRAPQLCPFLWLHRKRFDLNRLILPGAAGTLQHTLRINRSREIIATGLQNGLPAGFLLTPRALSSRGWD